MARFLRGNTRASCVIEEAERRAEVEWKEEVEKREEVQRREEVENMRR